MGVLGYLMGVLGYLLDLDRGPGWGVSRHFLRPQRHLAMAWRRRQAMGYIRERPLDCRGRPLNGNAHSS